MVGQLQQHRQQPRRDATPARHLHRGGTRAVEARASVFAPRYLILLPFIGVLLLGLVFYRLPTRNLKLALLAALVALVGANSLLSVVGATHSQSPNGQNYAVTKAVKAQGLTKGYARYYSGNINTYLSQGAAVFIPTQCESGLTHRYNWLIDSAEFSKPARQTFYEVDEDPTDPSCTANEIIKQFGLPVRIVKVNAATTLLVYPYDLATTIGE